MKCKLVNHFIFVVIIVSKCLCEELYDEFTTTEEISGVDSTIDDRVFEIYKKCCPLDQGLSRMRLNDSMQYECVYAVNENENATFDTILKYPLAPFKLLKSEIKMEMGFPTQCDAEEYLENSMSSKEFVSSDSCMDKIFLETTPNSTESFVGDGSVVVLSCNTTFQRYGFLTVPKFRPISKCCVGDMVYDVENNMCVKMESGENDFFSSLMDLVPDDFDILNLKYGLPPCDTPNYMFRYSSKNYKFEFSGYDLELKGGPKNIFLKEGTFCVDQTPEGGLVARTCKNKCDDGICVTKCCPEGQVFIIPPDKCGHRPKCGLSSKHGFSPQYHDVTNLARPVPVNYPDVLGIRYRDSCRHGKYILNPRTPKDENYLNIKNGDIILPALPNPNDHEFCTEFLNSACPDRPNILYKFLCFPEPAEKPAPDIKLKIYSVGMVISCAFLIATFLVYLFLPALQNLHGRIIMFYVAAMLVAYSCLARVQWPVVPDSTHCKFLGYSVYFSFLVAFSWLNIMCFDIWLTFGNTRSIQVLKKRSKEVKKLLLFSIYAFGIPTLLTLTIYIIDVNDYMAGFLDPDIGKAQCWFNTGVNRKPFLLYFILPAGIQILSNFVLFVLTALHCSKVKSEIRRMQAGSTGDKCKKRFLADKAMFMMNTKLFIVMGASWILEIISACYNDVDQIFYISDSFNVLLGVVIFFILVVKRKVYRLLRKRLGLKPDPRMKDTDTGATFTTGISRTSCVEMSTNTKHMSMDSAKISMMNGK